MRVENAQVYTEMRRRWRGDSPPLFGLPRSALVGQILMVREAGPGVIGDLQAAAVVHRQ